MATDKFFWQDMYEEMTERIDTVVESGKIAEEIKEKHKGFGEWSPEITSKNHQPIVQVAFQHPKLEWRFAWFWTK